MTSDFIMLAVWPAWIGWATILGVCAAAACGGVWVRRAALRAWQGYARSVRAEFTARNALAPARISGEAGGRPFLVETALTGEDGAPYYHTRGRMPAANPAGVVVALRRKSLLEEAQTRYQPAAVPMDDPAFDRLFFVTTNDVAAALELVNPQLRAELQRYGDIELLIRWEEVEWRRAGEVSDARALRRLMSMLGALAVAVDGLQPRRRTLTERMHAEELLARGV